MSVLKKRKRKRGKGRGVPIAPLESFETLTTKNNYAWYIVNIEITLINWRQGYWMSVYLKDLRFNSSLGTMRFIFSLYLIPGPSKECLKTCRLGLRLNLAKPDFSWVRSKLRSWGYLMSWGESYPTQNC
jgi:hypothetical protein